MAREQHSMTDEDLEAAQAKIDELREDVRDALAEDLGGNPSDYDATQHPVADGGE